MSAKLPPKEETLILSVYPGESPPIKTLTGTNKDTGVCTRRLLQHGQLPDKTLVICVFRRTFGTFRGILKYLCIYSTISREAPSDILQNSSVTRNAGCETLHLIKRINSVPIYSCKIFPSMPRSSNRSLPLTFSTCSMHAIFTLIYVLRIQINLTQECMRGSLFILGTKKVTMPMRHECKRLISAEVLR